MKKIGLVIAILAIFGMNVFADEYFGSEFQITETSTDTEYFGSEFVMSSETVDAYFGSEFAYGSSTGGGWIVGGFNEYFWYILIILIFVFLMMFCFIMVRGRR